MSRIRKAVHLLIEIEDIGASEKEIQEFIECETGFNNQMSAKNPLTMGDIEVLECYIEDKEFIY